MRPKNLKSKIFLDGGDPVETEKLFTLLGFLDGQTTNPSLISKNPKSLKRLESGELFFKTELLDFYKQVVQQVAKLIPNGSTSIEVYADKKTTADEMFRQGREMFTWIPGPDPEQARYEASAHIKYPTTSEGLKAAEMSVRAGMRVNMTLCFTQQQAAAVYAATRGAKKGQVFVSPFVGRLDDRGENGMELIKNIIEMYRAGDGHVEVLTASVRNMDHFYYALQLGSDIITAPFALIKEWGEKGMLFPTADFIYKQAGLKPIPYRELDLNRPWKEFNNQHELTDIGMEKFSADWNKLIQNSL